MYSSRSRIVAVAMRLLYQIDRLPRSPQRQQGRPLLALRARGEPASRSLPFALGVPVGRRQRGGLAAGVQLDLEGEAADAQLVPMVQHRLAHLLAVDPHAVETIQVGHLPAAAAADEAAVPAADVR